MGDTFQAYIRKIEDLPTLPVTANQILNLAGDPLFSLDKLKDILERDPAISAKILSVANAEKSVMNYTHSDAGFWLAEKWNLPESVLDTCLYHHAPSLAKRNQKRAAVIHIADYIVSRNVLGPVKKDANYPFDHNAIDILGFSDNTLSDLEESIDGIPFSDEIFFKEIR